MDPCLGRAGRWAEDVEDEPRTLWRVCLRLCDKNGVSYLMFAYILHLAVHCSLPIQDTPPDPVGTTV